MNAPQPPLTIAAPFSAEAIHHGPRHLSNTLSTAISDYGHLLILRMVQEARCPLRYPCTRYTDKAEAEQACGGLRPCMLL